MKFIIYSFILFISISSLSYAQSYTDLYDVNRYESIEADELNEYPEIHQSEESILREYSSSTGTYSDPYYTKNDNGVFSLSYSLATSYDEPSSLASFEGTYLNAFDTSYQNLWWGVQLRRTAANYDAIADERTSSSGDTNSVANTTRGSNQQVLLSLGLGLSYRLKALTYAFDVERLFETTSFFLSYIGHKDSTDDETYRGYGYNAEYVFAYRTSKSFYYGLKLSYHWVLLERAAIDEETLADRSLIFGWTSLGVDFGYIF